MQINKKLTAFTDAFVQNMGQSYETQCAIISVITVLKKFKYFHSFSEKSLHKKYYLLERCCAIFRSMSKNHARKRKHVPAKTFQKLPFLTV